ncbi:hemerythrin domain-containing protein [Alicyclobacillus sp. SO9]|uniref:hemerythrin domain-containing protein n=1 Tax=Alicyclobacillus sp. SO9 TaxID=2665646 RepID=UPI0018E6E29A|nr:hemerythrin domain-containing protein [Alicyclobacillus sp. SO9]QQE81001.1 hemerythrin domain-containing protein [Alicyclobacillus sp. SO9]
MSLETIQLKFSDKTVRTVFQNGQGRMMQLSLPEGEGLQKHVAKLPLALVVLTGKVTFSTDDTVVELGAQDMVTVPELREHAVTALQDSIILVTLMPGTGAVASENESDLETAYSNSELRNKIAPELLPFVDDHAHVVAALESLGREFSAASVRSALRLIGTELDRHFVYEEEILFPRLTALLGGPDVGPVPKLLKEHQTIRTQHETCSSLLDASHVESSVSSTLEMQMQQLSHNLLQHIAKEDNHLFSMASRLLSAEDKHAIARELQEREKSNPVVD